MCPPRSKVGPSVRIKLRHLFQEQWGKEWPGDDDALSELWLQVRDEMVGVGNRIGHPRLEEAYRKVLGLMEQTYQPAGAPMENLIREIPDHPKPGILFRDITPLLADATGLNTTIERLMRKVPDCQFVMGIEARGFIFGSLLAHQLGVGFVPVRKKGKLPYKTISESYDLEYGQAEVEVHEDAIPAQAQVLIVDDLIATGGTMTAAIRLAKRLKADVVGCAAVIDLPALGGSNLIEQMGIPTYTLLRY